MARKSTVLLVCDVTGLPDAETRIFAANDHWYAMDLAGEVLRRWDEVIAEFVQFAHEIGRVGRLEPQQALTVDGAKSATRRRRRHGPHADSKLVRPWWKENESLVKERTGYDWRPAGIIPGPVNQLYLEHQAGS